VHSVEGETHSEPLRSQRHATTAAPTEAPPSSEGWSGLHALLVARLRGGTTSLHDAEDLASETLWRLFEWMRHHGPPRCLHAMSLGIAHNLR
jgi:DNA-directed RNA polymerase specialized sigma24 family protein